MTANPIPLESIQPCFEGIVPATLSSCSADGVPNISYLSIVHRLDSERIAVTNQFLSKTSENIRQNPHVMFRVVHPEDYSQYDLEACFLHAETSGQLFDRIRLELDAIAAATGMSDSFRLRSVDVFRVDRCTRVGDPPQRSRPSGTVPPLGPLRAFVGRLASSGDLAEATTIATEALDDLFGFRHSMVLLHDEASQRLFVVAAHGYDAGRIGAEVLLGDGIIGIAARRRHGARIAHLGRSRAFAAAVSEGDLDEVPLRGLDDVMSALAAPLLLQDRLVGVLYLESPTAGTFDAEAAETLEIVAGHLAVTIALLEGGGAEPRSVPAPVAAAAPRADAGRHVRFHEPDGSLFVDGEYVVRGVPGRILFHLLSEHIASGRTQFTNKELRLERSLELPAGNDNLEARLLVVRRRLAERDLGIALERVGRGRLELAVGGPLTLERS